MSANTAFSLHPQLKTNRQNTIYTYFENWKSKKRGNEKEYKSLSTKTKQLLHLVFFNAMGCLAFIEVHVYQERSQKLSKQHFRTKNKNKAIFVVFQ